MTDDDPSLPTKRAVQHAAIVGVMLALWVVSSIFFVWTNWPDK